MNSTPIRKQKATAINEANQRKTRKQRLIDLLRHEVQGKREERAEVLIYQGSLLLSRAARFQSVGEADFIVLESAASRLKLLARRMYNRNPRAPQEGAAL